MYLYFRRIPLTYRLSLTVYRMKLKMAVRMSRNPRRSMSQLIAKVLLGGTVPRKDVMVSLILMDLLTIIWTLR